MSVVLSVLLDAVLVAEVSAAHLILNVCSKTI
jgi:hypothetical protein